MHISAELKAIAVLSTMLVPALGAVTAGQITTELQDMNKAVQNIINEASSLPAATLVDEVNSITTNLDEFNSELPGTVIVDVDVQTTLALQIDINAILLTAVFELEIGASTESSSVEDKTAVDNSAIGLYNTYGDTVAALGQLGSTIEAIVPGVEANLTKAIKDLQG